MPSAVLQGNGQVVPCSATMEWLICTPCGCNEMANTHARSSFFVWRITKHAKCTASVEWPTCTMQCNNGVVNLHPFWMR